MGNHRCRIRVSQDVVQLRPGMKQRQGNRNTAGAPYPPLQSNVLEAGGGNKSDRPFLQVFCSGQKKGGNPVGCLEEPAIGETPLRSDNRSPLRKLLGPCRNKY